MHVFRSNRWQVTICTRGGNRSWSGLVKYLDPSRYDFLFVLVGDGRRWFIPSAAVGGGRGLTLGGPKYAEFEVEPGGPMPDRTLIGPPLQSPSPTLGGMSEWLKEMRL